jgi:hypothetical protein
MPYTAVKTGLQEALVDYIQQWIKPSFQNCLTYAYGMYSQLRYKYIIYIYIYEFPHQIF